MWPYLHTDVRKQEWPTWNVNAACSRWRRRDLRSPIPNPLKKNGKDTRT